MSHFYFYCSLDEGTGIGSACTRSFRIDLLDTVILREKCGSISIYLSFILDGAVVTATGVYLYFVSEHEWYLFQIVFLVSHHT